MPAHRSIVFCLFLGMLTLTGCGNPFSRQQPTATLKPTVTKQPVNFAKRAFDSTNPPSDMPPPSPGEDAACDSEFLSNASVGGETRQTDATHATITVTQVKMTLQLNVTIWAPADVTQHVMDHEEGHHQISEYYYKTADKTAERIAAGYMGRQINIAGADLNAESNRALQQLANEITDAYNKELDPEPTQLLYDTITDHSRNDVVATDAVVHAIKNSSVESN